MFTIEKDRRQEQLAFFWEAFSMGNVCVTAKGCPAGPEHIGQAWGHWGIIGANSRLLTQEYWFYISPRFLL